MQQAISEMSVRGGTPKVDESFRFASEFILRAESYGFDITLVAERFLGPDLESWVLASALASMTSRIELMVAVHPGIINPQVAAKMGATLDRISGGRFAVNVVNGWWQQEFDVFGNGSWLPQSDARYSRMEEFMRVMRGLWSDDEHTSEGQFYSVRNGQVPTKAFRQPSPPIYAASQAPAGKDAVAHYADCWFYQQQGNFRDFASAAEQVERAIEEMDTLSGRYGRSVGIGISAHVICADTMEEAEQLATALEQYGKGGTVNFIAATGLSATLVGTADVIAERLNHYQHLGLQLAMLHFHPMMDGLDRFNETVRPQLAASTAAKVAATPVHDAYV